jgi:diguanylate cyclase (GGDEF)-like protein
MVLWLSALIGLIFQAPILARNVQFERITTEDGLSQENVTDMVQDIKGYMWFGTQEGLNRYDGYAFKHYEHNIGDPDSIADDWIWSLLIDHNGQLWAGTNSGGLSRYDEAREVFINYLHDVKDPGSISSNQVRFVFEDSQNILWIGTNDGGLNRLQAETGTFTHYRHEPGNNNSLPSDSVNFIHERPDGTLWIATDSGIAILDQARTRIERHEAGSNLNIRVMAEFEGSLWMGTHANGLRVFNPVSHDITEYHHRANDAGALPGNIVRDLLVDHQGVLWIATDSGLAEWLPDQGRFNSYRNNPLDQYSLTDNRIDSLMQDSGNVFWVGTYGGISRWNFVSDAFQNYHTGSGHLSFDLITAMAEANSGEIWIGTYGEGINRLRPANNSEQFYEAAPVPDIDLEDQRVMAIAIDDDENIWIGTRTSGLYHLVVDTGEVKHFVHDALDDNSLSNNGITAISVVDDLVWVGTYGGGLNRLDFGTGKFTRFLHDEDDSRTIGSNRVLALYWDSGGEFWIGTEAGGLNRFNPSQEIFTRFVHDGEDPFSLSNDTAWEIIESSDGSLWVATLGAGLNRWSAEDRVSGKVSFTHLTKGDGLRSDTIYGILEDGSGHMWLSGNRGLSELIPGSNRIRHFDWRNGIRAEEFNFGARLKSRSGLLLFGGTEGMVVFNPEDVGINTHMPSIVLSARSNTVSAVTDYSRKIEPTELTLAYNDRFVDFRFAALDFASPDKNQYLYMLQGFDDGWTDPGQFRRATYTNLPAGEYFFKVRASNNDGVWNNVGTTISVNVIPPPWLSTQAYIFYVLIVGTLLVTYLGMQRRKRAVEEQVRTMLEKEVTLRTHELGDRNKELEVANEQLTLASMSDALTGLHNRRYLYNYLESQIASLNRLYSKLRQQKGNAELIRKEGSLFFMMIDLDSFKAVNDSFGHAAGDEVLIHVRDVLRASTRDSDTIIRWGGDEFLVVGQSENLEGVEHLAERIRTGLANHSYTLGDGKVGSVTGSIGFAHFPFNPHNPQQFTWEQVVAVADQAAYVAKYNGKDSWVSFSGNADTEQVDIINMKDKLASVIKEQHVTMTTSIKGEVVFDF